MNTNVYTTLIIAFFMRNFFKNQILCRRDLIKYVDRFSKRFIGKNTLSESTKYKCINDLVKADVLTLKQRGSDRVVMLSDRYKSSFEDKIAIDEKPSWIRQRELERDKANESSP